MGDLTRTSSVPGIVSLEALLGMSLGEEGLSVDATDLKGQQRPHLLVKAVNTQRVSFNATFEFSLYNRRTTAHGMTDEAEQAHTGLFRPAKIFFPEDAFSREMTTGEFFDSAKEWSLYVTVHDYDKSVHFRTEVPLGSSAFAVSQVWGVCSEVSASSSSSSAVRSGIGGSKWSKRPAHVGRIRVPEHCLRQCAATDEIFKSHNTGHSAALVPEPRAPTGTQAVLFRYYLNIPSQGNDIVYPRFREPRSPPLRPSPAAMVDRGAIIDDGRGGIARGGFIGSVDNPLKIEFGRAELLSLACLVGVCLDKTTKRLPRYVHDHVNIDTAQATRELVVELDHHERALRPAAADFYSALGLMAANSNRKSSSVEDIVKQLRDAGSADELRELQRQLQLAQDTCEQIEDRVAEYVPSTRRAYEICARLRALRAIERRADDPAGGMQQDGSSGEYGDHGIKKRIAWERRRLQLMALSLWDEAGRDEGSPLNLTWTLSVHLISGRDLASRDFNGKSDPYVKVHIGSNARAEHNKKGSKFKSKVVKGTLNPQWDEVAEFSSESRSFGLDDSVHVQVMDWDFVGSNDQIGAATPIAISDLLDGTERAGWLQLRGPDGEHAGDVFVRMQVKIGNIELRAGAGGGGKASLAGSFAQEIYIERLVTASPGGAAGSGGSKSVPPPGVLEPFGSSGRTVDDGRAMVDALRLDLTERSEAFDAHYALLCGVAEMTRATQLHEGAARRPTGRDGQLDEDAWEWIKVEFRARFGITQATAEAAELRSLLCVWEEEELMSAPGGALDDIIERIHLLYSGLRSKLLLASADTKSIGNKPDTLEGLNKRKLATLRPGLRQSVQNAASKDGKLDRTMATMPWPGAGLHGAWPRVTSSVYNNMQGMLNRYLSLMVRDPSEGSGFKRILHLLVACREASKGAAATCSLETINNLIRIEVTLANKRAMLDGFGVPASRRPRASTMCVLDMDWITYWMDAATNLLELHENFLNPVVKAIFPELCLMKTVHQTIWSVVRQHVELYLRWYMPPRGMTLAMRVPTDHEMSQENKGRWTDKLTFNVNDATAVLRHRLGLRGSVLQGQRERHGRLKVEEHQLTGDSSLLYPASQIFLLRRTLYGMFFDTSSGVSFRGQVSANTVNTMFNMFDRYVRWWLIHLRMTMSKISVEACNIDDYMPEGQSLISSGFVDTFAGVTQFLDYLKWARLDNNSVAALAFANNVAVVSQEMADILMNVQNVPAVLHSSTQAGGGASGRDEEDQAAGAVGRSRVISTISTASSVESAGRGALTPSTSAIAAGHEGAARPEVPLISERFIQDAFVQVFGKQQASLELQAAEEAAKDAGFMPDIYPHTTLSAALCVRLNNAHRTSTQLLTLIEDGFGLDVDAILDAIDAAASVAAGTTGEAKGQGGSGADDERDNDVEDSSSSSSSSSEDEDDHGNVAVTTSGRGLDKRITRTLTRTVTRSRQRPRQLSSGTKSCDKHQQLQTKSWQELEAKRGSIGMPIQQGMLDACVKAQKAIRQRVSTRLVELAEALVEPINVEYIIEAQGFEQERRKTPFFGSEDVGGYLNEILAMTYQHMSEDVFDLFRSKLYDALLKRIEMSFTAPCFDEDRYLMRSRLMEFANDVTRFLYSDTESAAVMRRLERKRVKIRAYTAAIPVATEVIAEHYSMIHRGDNPRRKVAWQDLVEEDLIKLLDGRDFDEGAQRFVREQERVNREVRVAQAFPEIDVNEDVLFDLPCKNKTHRTGTLYITDHYMLFNQSFGGKKSSRIMCPLVDVRRIVCYEHWRYQIHNQSSLRVFTVDGRHTLHGFSDPTAFLKAIRKAARGAGNPTITVDLGRVTRTVPTSSSNGTPGGNEDHAWGRRGLLPAALTPSRFKRYSLNKPRMPHPPSTPISTVSVVDSVAAPQGVREMEGLDSSDDRQGPEDDELLGLNKQHLASAYGLSPDDDLLESHEAVLLDHGNKVPGTMYIFRRTLVFQPRDLRDTLGEQKQVHIVPMDLILTINVKMGRGGFYKTNAVTLTLNSQEMQLALRNTAVRKQVYNTIAGRLQTGSALFSFGETPRC